MKQNYQRKLDDVIKIQGEKVPALLLHSCCAPCSSYVLEYLSQYFSITVYYYNPNIYPEEEYRKRVAEQQAFIAQLPASHPITFQEGTFDPAVFYEAASGMEDLPEKGQRCYHCYRLRLTETARAARESGYEYFCSTLSISPMKDAQWLNEIGEELQAVYGIKWLPSDFKKREGYKRSVQLSEKYGLYRQDYCGCVFSYNSRRVPDLQALDEKENQNNTCHAK